MFPIYVHLCVWIFEGGEKTFCTIFSKNKNILNSLVLQSQEWMGIQRKCKWLFRNIPMRYIHLNNSEDEMAAVFSGFTAL